MPPSTPPALAILPRSNLPALALPILAVLLSGCAGPTPAGDGPAKPVSVSAQDAPRVYAAAPPAALPRIIAHRGGTGDAPENTLEAIRAAIAHHADAIWLTVQLSKDGIPVLYRPADLSALTDATGAVHTRTAAELAKVNAGWSFKTTDPQGRDDHPYRRAPAGIPTLRAALMSIPPDIPVILDMKSLPAEPQTRAVARILDDENAWSRVTLYSTEAAYQKTFAVYPRAKMFESRDATRTRLLRVLLDEGCVDPPPARTSSAFELHRTLTVTEKFTLGEGRSVVHATLWTPATVACFRQRPDVHIVAIAVNDAADYRAAACLGIDAVLADSPAKMAAIRAATDLSSACVARAR